MKKASPEGPKTNLIQLCGGLGVQLKKSGTYPELKFPDTIKGWQGTWFYCKDIPTSEYVTGLPPFSPERLPNPPKKNLKLTKAERIRCGYHDTHASWDKKGKD